MSSFGSISLILLVLLPALLLAQLYAPGIDNIQDLLPLLNGQKIGLITNPTGMKGDLSSTTIDFLFNFQHPTIHFTLTALFAPEHGIRGDQPPGAPFPSYIDPVTQLPVFSLYDKNGTRAPTKEMLENVTLLLIDVQDIGARCYTYISTMALSMKSSAQFQVPFVVLDRLNPISAAVMEGPILEISHQSFVGIWKIPLRHGMTIGELAQLMNVQMQLNCELHVVKAVQYKRNQSLQTINYLGFVPPSPNIPNFESAALYPGIVLFESCHNVSLGRGTTTPFQVVGAPYITNPWEFVNSIYRYVNQEEPELKYLLNNIRLIPTFFTPTTSYHANLDCAGVRIVLVDKNQIDSVRSIELALVILRVMLDSFGVKQIGLSYSNFVILDGTDFTYKYVVEQRGSLNKLYSQWNSDLQSYSQATAKYLLYQ